MEIISSFFGLCVYILQCLGGSCGNFGIGYEIANIFIFVILQPFLIILFFLLWRKEKRKSNNR